MRLSFFPHHPNRLVWLVVLAGVGFAIWHFWPAGKSGHDEIKVPSVLVHASAVTRTDVPLTVKLVGTVYPYQSVAIKARLDSQIREVRFKDGDRVRQGDILFVLDDSALQAQRQQYVANLARDQAQLANAKAQYERSAQLLKRGFETREKASVDKAAYESAKATVAATQAALNNSTIQLDYMTITAPITGRAGTINATLGNNVKANDTQPLVTINEVDPIRIQFSVPQRYFDELKTLLTTGEAVPVEARRNEDNTDRQGVLEYIDNAIDQSSGTFVARARFENADEKLWPGMFVDVIVTLKTIKNGLVIPAEAVQTLNDQDFVFVVNEQTHKATKTPIHMLRLADGRALVTDGLSEGALVITDGLLRLTDGSVVEVADKAVPAAKTEGKN